MSSSSPAAGLAEMPETDAARRRLLKGGRLAALGVALCAAMLAFGSVRITQFYHAASLTRGENTMRLVVATLHGELARFERLPRFLADQPIVRAVARHWDDPDTVRAANEYLQQVNGLLGSLDLYVMRGDGLTVAASNYDGAAPFTGQNFSYRPYFSDAIAGEAGRFFALGMTSLRRGYYFSAPIREAGEIVGVIAQKIDLERLEGTWRASDYVIAVSDLNGVIFLSGQQEWIYSSLTPLSTENLRQSARTQRYAGTEIRPLPLQATGSYRGHDLVRITENGQSRDFMVLSEEMPEAGWTVQVLIDMAPAKTQAQLATLAGVLTIALATLGAAVLMQRRDRQRERNAFQRATLGQLEDRVRERTAELASVNRRLEGEVAERRATETELRRTQRRLIQSGKLAAIGQMSAALSHEFNQPLGALRNFAENADTYMQRGRVGDAQENIRRILGLTDRMSEISRTLRNFARKPRQQLAPVELSDLVRESIGVISWRLKPGAPDLDTAGVPPGLHVVAEPVRLQQVLVNLMANALDALRDMPAGRIAIAARRQGDTVLLSVTDNGPGIPPDLRERIFDPFFSTKGVGQGLGLGLSISYNIVRDFGGELRLRDAPGGGAVFEMELRAAPEA